MSEVAWNEWLSLVRSGDRDATQGFWDTYGQPLLRLAEKNLQANLRRRVDPEDIVQSAFRTVFRRLQTDEFNLHDDSQLWRLMCAVTLNKTRRKARWNQQAKRDVKAENYPDAAPSEPWNVRGTGPQPEEALILVDLIENLVVRTTDEEERSVLLMKLDDYSNQEIADRLKRSVRTINRILERLKERCQAMI